MYRMEAFLPTLSPWLWGQNEVFAEVLLVLYSYQLNYQN